MYLHILVSKIFYEKKDKKTNKRSAKKAKKKEEKKDYDEAVYASMG
jgi:hypothetical protein